MKWPFGSVMLKALFSKVTIVLTALPKKAHAPIPASSADSA